MLKRLLLLFTLLAFGVPGLGPGGGIGRGNGHNGGGNGRGRGGLYKTPQQQRGGRTPQQQQRGGIKKYFFDRDKFIFIFCLCT